MATTVTKAAAEYQMFKKLEDNKLGTHQKSKILAAREEKRGNKKMKKLKKGFYEREGKRESNYVWKEMNWRAGLHARASTPHTRSTACNAKVSVCGRNQQSMVGPPTRPHQGHQDHGQHLCNSQAPQGVPPGGS